MTSTPFKLLLIEDNPGDARLVQVALADHAPGEFALTWVARLAEAQARIQAGRFDVVLSDLGLPDSDGLATAQAISDADPALPLVVLTGSNNEDLGRAAIRQGAQDYLVKAESDGVLIARTLRYAIERKRLENELREAKESLERRVAERTAELGSAVTTLNESLAQSRALAETASDAIIIADQGGMITGWNPAAEHMFGYTPAEVFGQALTLVIPERYRGDHWVGVKRVSAGGERHLVGRHAELHGLTKAGTEFPLELSLSTWETSEGKVFAGIIRDISERKRAEQALTRQKDLYEALSQTNQTIVRGVSREELFAAVCRIAVEHGRFRFAWIGMIDENDHALHPLARYGEDAGYIDAIDAAEGAVAGTMRDVTGRTLLSRIHLISNDFLNDAAMAPWHEAATRAGVRAAAKFPIAQGGAVIGAINLYAGEAGFFTPDLVATLNEMANDVSFALDNLQREAERKRTAQALQQAETQFRGLVEQSIVGIYIIQDGSFVYVNPRFAEVFGYASAEEMIGRDPLSLIVEKDRGIAAENIRRRFEGELETLSYGFTGLCKDGSLIEVGLNSARATHHGRSAIIGILQDISEKKRAEEQSQRYLAQIETAFMRTVEVATTLSEMRDPYTAGHERRVAAIAVAIGAELGFDSRRQEGLRVAGYLHDIGKITIPSEILSKPGKLTAIEFELIKGHSQASYDVLKKVEFPWPVGQIVLQHHERIDGSGYPQGLKGEAILLEARILAVADVVEAMSSHRPYRAGLGTDKALAEIERGRGTIYDPVVADACLKLFREKGYVTPP